MYDEILTGITRRLDELWEGACAIYTGNVEQGLSEPCFFVQFLEPSERPFLGSRSLLTADLCIQYFPEESQGESQKKSQELLQAAETLMGGMEWITLPDGSLLRGIQKSWRAADGILHFFVSYRMMIYRQREREESMEHMEMKKGMVKQWH